MEFLPKKVKFGILGTANIARKNVRAILLSNNCELIGIASRDLLRAKEFISSLNLPKSIIAYGSYEELLDNINIDAVYIPLPTSEHLKWVQLAATKGKHILLEKPCAISTSVLEEMLKTCKQYNVFFMDGVMYNHHSRMKALLRELHDPILNVKAYRIHSSFSFLGDEAFFQNNIRTSSLNDPLGALGDLAWYSIRLALLCFSSYTTESYLTSIIQSHTSTELYKGLLFPISTIPSCQVTCLNWSLDGKVPLDCEGRITFGYDNIIQGNQILKIEKVLIFDASFLLPLRQTFEITCLAAKESNQSQVIGNVSDKIFRCNDFVIPNQPSIASFTLQSISQSNLTDRATRLLSCDEIITSINSNSSLSNHNDNHQINQETSLFTEFSRILLDHPKDFIESCKIWLGLSMATQLLVDTCMESLSHQGTLVKVPEDKWLNLQKYHQSI